MKNKILISFREGGANGGPYNSHLRIMESALKDSYDFIPLIIPKGRLGIFNPKLTINLIKQILKNKPQIVHFTGLELVGFHVGLACKVLGLKNTIVAIHGSTSESEEIKKTIIKKHILNFIEKLTLGFASYSYGVSNYTNSIDVVERYAKNHQGTIYNIIKPRNDNLQFNLKDDYNIESEKIIVVSVGRIEKEKGFEILASIIKKTSNPNIVFLVIGDGSYLAELKHLLSNELSSKKVIFTGFKENPIDFMMQCDIFVMPSLHETFCMALAEAGKSGCALMANNVGGMREIIDHEINGYLVDGNNEEKYIEILEYFEKNREALAEMKVRSKTLIDSKFNDQGIIDQLSSLCRSVLCVH